MQKGNRTTNTAADKNDDLLNGRFATIENLVSGLAWAVLTAVLAYASRRFVGAELNEIGDFAANSLLIQDAKHLQLFVGHYSRIGFNHPGPFILYVLAAGEWLLFDCLHWVKSPLAGQIYAATALNAGWLVLIARLLFRMLQSRSAMAVSWLFVVTIAAYVDHTFISGIWFPYLFYWMFAAFCLALMRFASGRTDSLITLALSCGALLHGHVSFFGICGLMLAGAAFFFWHHYQYDDEKTTISIKGFVYKNGRLLVAPLIIGLFFLLPLLIETILHFPGPIAKYAAFSQGHKANSLGGVLQFMSQYWAYGFLPLIIGLLGTVLLKRCAGADNAKVTRNLGLAGAMPALLLANGGMLLYAIAGVDDLSKPYMGFFYFSVPAITIGLMAGYLHLSLKRLSRYFVVLFIALAALPYVYRQAALPPGYAPFFTDSNIPDYFRKFSGLSKQMIALDLDDQQDWEGVWSTILGLEIYAVRHGRPDLFCINKLWQISFTEKARCSTEQVGSLPRMIVSAAPGTSDLFGGSLTDMGGNIRVYARKSLRVPPQNMLNISNNKTLFSIGILQNGWSPVEGDFVWSDAKRASLSFAVDARAVAAIEFDIAAFLPRADFIQSASVLVNGVSVEVFHFDQARNREVRKVVLPAQLQHETNYVVELHIASPISPKQAGLSADTRMLGVSLYGFRVIEGSL